MSKVVVPRTQLTKDLISTAVIFFKNLPFAIKTLHGVLQVDIIHFRLSSLDGLLNFQKFETDLVNFPLIVLEILAFFVEFGPNYDVTATKTGVV